MAMIIALRADNVCAASIHKFLTALVEEFPFMVEGDNRNVPSVSTVEQLSRAIPSLLDEQVEEFVKNVR